MTKIAGSEAESGSVSQRYVSGDPDPYPNVTNPQHYKKGWLWILLNVSILEQVC
jgi:hypothetical protein